MNMTNEIYQSIKTATSNPYPVILWWDDAEIEKNISIALGNGWVTRSSVTQVFWTEKGVVAFKDMVSEIAFPSFSNERTSKRKEWNSLYTPQNDTKPWTDWIFDQSRVFIPLPF